MKKLIVLGLTFGLVVGIFLLAATAGHDGAPTETMAYRKLAPMAKAADKPTGALMEERMDAPGAPPPASAPMPVIAGLGGRGAGFGGGGLSAAFASPAEPKREAAKGIMKEKKAALADMAEGDSVSEGGGEAATRAWFPETFLFEPLVVTDAQGRANVPVKVPDRLTTWRVLALAHSREGSQAGAVASFLGTLPTYVEPVTPPTLYAGDEVRVPVQVVNTTAADVSSPLRFSATGATLSAAGGSVRVPAAGNAIEYVTLSTKTPGSVELKTTLGDTDAVAKTIEVLPAGKRELQTRGGSLAAPRTFDVVGPANALPGSEQVRLRVFPGALGLVRSELSAAMGRGGVAEDAYALQLLGRAPTLLRSLGGEPATDTIRDLSIVATQRVMRHSRAPSVDAATLLTEAALQHPDNPVLARLGERLAGQVAAAQRPDGTCQGATGWTLQRLLVTTADCVRAVQASTASNTAKQRAAAVAIKASGAFERNAARVNDGFTAAAILASGAVTGTVADALKKMVLDNIHEGEDGAKYLDFGAGVVRADGARPSRYEATALAVLALQSDPTAPLPDLGTYLLSGYSPVYGWGDGRANLLCLRAVSTLFKDPVPAGVALTLERDGVVVAEGRIDASKLQEVVSLDADASGSSGRHQWSVKAVPAVPGLGYSFTLVSYTPWKDEPGGGLELKTTVPTAMRVGQAAELELVASMPAGLGSSLRLALPAGVQTDTNQLDGLVAANTISRFETEDGAVTLHLNPLAPGASFSAKVRVIPTLAGKLQSGPSQLGPDGQSVASMKAFAPQTWVVAR